MTVQALQSFGISRARDPLARLRDVLYGAFRNIQHRHDHRLDRAAFLNLTRLDARLLDDIGVTREDVAWASALPIEVNAALALRKRVERRRRELGPTFGYSRSAK